MCELYVLVEVKGLIDTLLLHTVLVNRPSFVSGLALKGLGLVAQKLGSRAEV